MGCYYHTEFSITCDICKKTIWNAGGMLEFALEEVRKRGWLVRRKKHTEPTYKPGCDNHWYFCPECRPRRKRT